MSKKEEKVPEVPDEEVFVPDPDEELWSAKPLTLRSSVLLLRILAGTLARGTIRLMEYTKGDDVQLTEELVMELITVLDPPMLRAMLSIIVDAEPEVVEREFSLHKAVAVIVDFWEKENISKILGEVGRLASNQEFQERNAG